MDTVGTFLSFRQIKYVKVYAKGAFTPPPKEYISLGDMAASDRRERNYFPLRDLFLTNEVKTRDYMASTLSRSCRIESAGNES